MIFGWQPRKTLYMVGFSHFVLYDVLKPTCYLEKKILCTYLYHMAFKDCILTSQKNSNAQIVIATAI